MLSWLVFVAFFLAITLASCSPSRSTAAIVVTTTVGNTTIPTTADVPEARGYLISDVFFDRAAEQFLMSEVPQATVLRVQTGWRFWAAKISLENPLGANPNCIELIAEGVNVTVTDSGGFEHTNQSHIGTSPNSPSLPERLCPGTAVAAYIYGQVPANQIPESAIILGYQTLTEQLYVDLKERSTAHFPFSSEALRDTPSEVVVDTSSHHVHVYPIRVTNNAEDPRLVFSVEVENRGGHNMYSGNFWIIAVDNFGRLYSSYVAVGSTQWGEVIVPGERKIFTIEADAGTYNNSMGLIEEVYAVVYMKEADQVLNFYQIGSIFWDRSSSS